jgi:uncharacterized protein YdhG (YjbR/CyaY superfamily)
MSKHPSTPAAYISGLPAERKQVLEELREVISQNIPDGFEEGMSYGMISYHVPLTVYPPGYHASKEPAPLPFINIASQKNHVALYHMGIYALPDLLSWFKNEYGKSEGTRLDMGKSCIRFKKMQEIPYALIGELCGKISAQEWIEIYEQQIKR